MVHRVGVGLVSVGWMGRLHTRAYRAVPEHYPDLGVAVDLVSAADTDPATRTSAEEVLGYRRTTADYREVLADPDVDVVSICAPNFLHREVALAAAEAGKPFWIEKPMGRSAAESSDIARAAEAAGIVTSVGFNYRHAPAVAHARALVRSGAIGRVTNVSVRLLADYSADPLGALTWRFLRDRAGSGVLGDLLSHGADLAQYVVGRIDSVSAVTETFVRERPLPGSAADGHFSKGADDAAKGPVENEDYAALLGRFESGAVAVLEASRVAVGPRAEYALEVYGTSGSLRWDFQRLNELQLADDPSGYRTIMAQPGFGDFARFQPGAGTSMGFDDLKTIEASLFLSSVLEGRQLAPSASDAWSAAEIVEAAVRSDSARAWETVGAVTGPTTYDR
ncbi:MULTISPECIES: Gfo/Idh/MocA family protein [unclassified Rathayibacter]|uniref:Gfo/Idh/MocA family protein n=1 Tax=unclassified Rathayibacter TaxID=2609250 RepID=UPI0006F5C7C2|nr:Gfo/Idh/MocA family oxidoreductase [Rathayibacter sp. Leaf185]KQP95951.1 myo-inositol 2-dehydrogenase [Rathayibacter sp. Leaf294]KQS07672.1 myo-inositol 2-dehydrogenase [Rathayibacter sp. Leaf185]